MKKYKWGIIGPGKIAHKFANDLLLLSNAELFAVASRSIEKAKTFGEKYDAREFYDDHHLLINNSDVDVIYIATPHTFHKKYTIDCLKAGKAVLCEKPLGLNIEEVHEMINLAKNNGVFLMEAMWTSCLPHFQYVQKLIAESHLGKVKYLKSDFGFKADFDPDKRLFNKQLGGGSLLDIGIYPVFAALSFLGFPDDIKSSAGFSETGVDEQTHALLSYKDGAIAVLSSTFLNTTETETVIYCENGIIRINGRWHEPSSVDVISESETIHQDFEVNGIGYHYEASEVMKCLDKGLFESKLMSLNKSVMLAELLDRIKKEINLSY